MKKNKLLLHKQILAAVLSGGILLLPNWGYALPQGGQVVAGTGSIGTPGGDQMNITGSGNVAIDWNSFNVAQGESVKFSGMQAVLNYVTGNTKSEIFGNISGSGVHVFLVNPNGILFGATASVNVGELTASTRTIDNRKSFDGTAFSTLSLEAAQKVRGDIINLGELTADKILLEGDNISLLNAHMLKSSGNGNITLRADNKVTVGYEVTDKTTINVGDDAPGGHTVSDYTTGTGTKGSTVLAGAAVQDLCGNSKNITDAMLVHDIYELQAIDKNTVVGSDGHKYVQGDYMLANDIDASGTVNWHNGKGFASIGDISDWPNSPKGGFTGSLDGLDCKIMGLNIKRTDTSNYYGCYIGLFTILREEASVKNIRLTDYETKDINGAATIIKSYIEGAQEVGGIAGVNYGAISNVTNEADIAAGSLGEVGGIVGVNYGNLENIINKGTITSTGGSLGGIAGSNIGGTINNARNEADIEAKNSFVGGIAGQNSAMGTISNSINSGEITGSGVNEIGGICGYNGGGINGGGIIDSCTNTEDAAIVITGGSNIGGIVGRNDFGVDILDKTHSITNSNNYAAVRGKDHVGGIVGHDKDWIEKNQNFGAITGTGDYVGGIAGANNENPAIIANCTNSGAVTGTGKYVGGITGYNGYTGDYGTAKIINSHNTESGSVSGNSFVGGVVGYNSYTDANGGAIIEKSTNNGDVTATGYYTNNGKKYSYVGGIVGYNYKGAITDVMNNGKIIGSNYAVGGIAGYNYGDITNAYNKGTITSSSQYVSGITGYNYGNINNVYNSGDVTGTFYTGGIAGYYAKGSITNVYNIGNITGKTSYVGGIVGTAAASSGAITNAYYALFDGATIKGYLKHQGSGTLLTLAEFGKAFEKGLDTASKDSWKFYNGYTDPLLKGFLKKITIDGDSITGGDTVYNGSEQNAGLSGLADGILVGSKKNAGDYDLNDLLYSGQDGYDIEIVNDGTKFIINKAQLTVTADGVEIDANSVLPDFTGSISGLVGGERWEDLGVELDSDLHFTTDADGKTAGKFAINGSLDKTLANYEIKQADSNAAALVVNKNDKPPQPPDLSNLPQEGIYQNALVNLAVAERENRPEQQSIKRRVTDSRISDKEEQVKVTIEGDGIKTE